ncbi:MAG TPA: hypothetical protein ENK49_08815 [Gammaproteobacteria bacterium]|nr:hypothetical protein [Gammaproteobacteria bacterium]
MNTPRKPEKRQAERRRDFNSKLATRSGSATNPVVYRDRRSMPDRRLNNIQLEFIPLQLV